MKNATFSEQVKFHPFVGKNYEKQEHKVLLLGTSHNGREANTDFTKEVLELYLSGRAKRWKRFFNCIISVLYGSKEDPVPKFENIAFYNYAQVLATDERPNLAAADFTAAREPLREVAGKLKPDSVISFGYDMIWSFPTADKNPKSNVSTLKFSNGIEYKLWLNNLDIGGALIPIYSLAHPAGSQFNWRAYHEYFKTLPQFDAYTKRK